MVFTMGSKDGIDPTVLHPGRLDVHMHFLVCTFPAFKTLTCNYLGVKDHKLFTHVEEHLQTGASFTPTEIGEIMIINRSSPSRALKSVINASNQAADRRENPSPSVPARTSPAFSLAVLGLSMIGIGIFVENIETILDFVPTPFPPPHPAPAVVSLGSMADKTRSEKEEEEDGRGQQESRPKKVRLSRVQLFSRLLFCPKGSRRLALQASFPA